jgi:IS30 family transposase
VGQLITCDGTEADHQAWESALRPKRWLLAIHVRLQKIVASKLISDWSPEQVSEWLKIQYPDDESMRVSHETIYSLCDYTSKRQWLCRTQLSRTVLATSDLLHDQRQLLRVSQIA